MRTSVHIRDAAKRELDIYQSHDKGSITKESASKTIATSHGYPEITEPPRVVDQVWHLVQKVEYDKNKVFVPLDHWPAATKGTTKEVTVLAESKNQDRVV